MTSLNFLAHQKEALRLAENRKRVAFYHDMGTGKTFVGAEQMFRVGNKLNLLVCQKSKVDDWCEHFSKYYPWEVVNCRKLKSAELAEKLKEPNHKVLVINYDMLICREVLYRLENFTLLLDESQKIKNERTKRTTIIMRMRPDSVILLSGTPIDGKYEELVTQSNLLGWRISKSEYWKRYIKFYEYNDGVQFYNVVTGYKNVDELKTKLRAYGAQFLSTEEAGISLPQQNDIYEYVDCSPEYKKFKKEKRVEIDGEELTSDSALVELLRARQLAGTYSKSKRERFTDLIESTNDRIIVFYNFDAELEFMKTCLIDRPVFYCNGKIDNHGEYSKHENSIVFVQYQSGADSIEFQEANRIIYYSPTLSFANFSQSKKRIHRVGQKRPCFYHYLIMRDSVEENIYKSLQKREDYNKELFLNDF